MKALGRYLILLPVVCVLAQRTTNDDYEAEHVINRLKHQMSEMMVKINSLLEKQTESENKITILENLITTQRNTIKNTTTTYVRWGRNNCGAIDSRLVYKGYIGSSEFRQNGSGSNYLCLTDSPTWEYSTLNTSNPIFGLIWGTEYEGGRTAGWPHWPFTYDDGLLDDHDAPCAVCEVVGQTASMMVPGTHACPAGWSPQYQGYLATTRWEHRRSEYICVDKDPDVVVGSTGSNDVCGHLYYTRARCGALPCPPYQDHREVTCVVCTK